MFRTKWNLIDLAICAGVVLVALALLIAPLPFQKKGERLAVITPNGTSEYLLSEDRVLLLQSEGVEIEVVVERGEVFVRHSTCPDGVCTASAKISRAGQSILCAPAGVTLLIKGGESDVDFVAG